jgi:hypothetical protein
LPSLPRQIFNERCFLKFFVPSPCLVDVFMHDLLVTSIKEWLILLLRGPRLIAWHWWIDFNLPAQLRLPTKRPGVSFWPTPALPAERPARQLMEPRQT